MSTKKQFRALSHFERLNNPDCSTPCVVQIVDHYTVSSEYVKDEKTNRVVKKLVTRIDNPDPFKHLKVSDFSLENLQASGAIDNVVPCSLSHDTHSTISTLENSAKNISKTLKVE